MHTNWAPVSHLHILKLFTKALSSQTRKPGPKPSCEATSDSGSERGLLNSHFSFSTGQDSPTDLCCHHLTEETNPTGWLHCGRCHGLWLTSWSSGPAQGPSHAWSMSSPASPPDPFRTCCSASLQSTLEPYPAIPTATHWSNSPWEASQDPVQDWVLK